MAGAVLARGRRGRDDADPGRRDQEGLAAAVYGIFGDDEQKLRGLLQIPEELTLVAGISLGYPRPDPGWSSKTSRATQRRRAVDELVHWNTWTS